MKIAQRYSCSSPIKILGGVIIVIIVIGTAEVFSFVLNQIFLKKEAQNDFIKNVVLDCIYYDLLFPHPYLAHVYNANPPCNSSFVNKQGMLDVVDIPLEKNPETFLIMITGGSSASQLAFSPPPHGGKKYLEEELNRCYIPPDGKKIFTTVNGSSGAWKQPQQAIMALIYGGSFDGIITFDGFNEHYMIANPYVSLEVPSNNFAQVTDLKFIRRHSIKLLVNVNASLAHLFLKSKFLSQSQTLTFVYYSLGRIINSANVINNQELTTDFGSLFSFPEDWDEERKRNHNMDQYVHYITMMHTMGEFYDAKTSFFMQPVPALHKQLTERELEVVGDLSYGDVYRYMEDHLLVLTEAGIDIISLTKVFVDVEEDIYADPTHFRFDSESNSSKGNEIVAEHIAEHLAQVWGFRTKEECQ